MSANPHLAGPWQAVLATRDGFVLDSIEEAIEDFGEDEEVRITIVRDTAVPTDRNGTTGDVLRLPGSYKSGDMIFELEAYLTDPDDESMGAAARWAQAQAMCAGLNAATANAAHTDRTWLIWSNQWGTWWRDGGNGYTSDLTMAGRFTEQEARSRAAGGLSDAGHARNLPIDGSGLSIVSNVGEIVRGLTEQIERANHAADGVTA